MAALKEYSCSTLLGAQPRADAVPSRVSNSGRRIAYTSEHNCAFRRALPWVALPPFRMNAFIRLAFLCFLLCCFVAFRFHSVLVLYALCIDAPVRLGSRVSIWSLNQILPKSHLPPIAVR